MSTNTEPIPTALEPRAPGNDALRINADGAQHREAAAPSLTEALRLRRNLLQSLWVGVRQLPRGRRIVLLIRICVSLAQIIAFIPILSLPGSHRISPSHEDGRVCNPDSLFKYLVVHMVRLALDIPVELYLGLSPHRTRQGRRAGPEARAIAERDRPLGSEYLDVKVGKISTLLGIASLVIFFVGNAIVYSSTECSRRPAEAVPLFWSALASLIVVYIFIVEIAVLAFLIVCALPLLIVIMRALGLNHRLPQRELHPETGKIDQQEVDKRVKLVYYTPAEADDENQPADQTSAQDASTSGEGAEVDARATSVTPQSRAGMGSRQATQESLVSASHPVLGRLSRLTRLIVARRRSAPSASEASKTAASTPATATGTPAAEGRSTAPSGTTPGQRSGLKYPLHPLPAHRATCPICLCDFEEPEAGQEPEPEPLRLLACGHVMHRSCVDQWLTTVSGRCPVCQKAVIPGADEEAASNAPANEAEAVEMQPLPSATH